MDLSKLNSNEKLAVYGAAAAIVGALVAQFGSIYGAGGLWLSLLLAVAMLAVVFMPQWSPSTTLPGSKGTLMLIIGGIAGVGALLGLLAILPALGVFGLYGGLWFIGILIGIAGGLMMGWAGWQEFQAEGGKFQLGAQAGGTAGTTPPPAAPAPPPTTSSEPAPPASTPPAAPTTPSEPMAPPMSGQGTTPTTSAPVSGEPTGSAEDDDRA